MSECVVRMEMPEECPCELWHNCNPYTKYSMKIFDASMERFPRPKPLCKGCRIICQLPEWHGRLADADALLKFMFEYDDYEGAKEAHDLDLIHRDSICYLIEEAPTIVPAERSE